MNDTTTPFASMADVREANRKRGDCWFSAGTMSWFNCKVETTLYRGHWFLTSDHPNGEPQRWSVRYAEDDGRITTIGDFMGHPHHDAALAAMWEDINSR